MNFHFSPGRQVLHNSSPTMSGGGGGEGSSAADCGGGGEEVDWGADRKGGGGEVEGEKEEGNSSALQVIGELSTSGTELAITSEVDKVKLDALEVVSSPL
jgi:hypothetical protein